jgi:hypothetical protein
VVNCTSDWDLPEEEVYGETAHTGGHYYLPCDYRKIPVSHTSMPSDTNDGLRIRPGPSTTSGHCTEYRCRPLIFHLLIYLGDFCRHRGNREPFQPYCRKYRAKNPCNHRDALFARSVAAAAAGRPHLNRANRTATVSFQPSGDPPSGVQDRRGGKM